MFQSNKVMKRGVSVLYQSLQRCKHSSQSSNINAFISEAKDLTNMQDGPVLMKVAISLAMKDIEMKKSLEIKDIEMKKSLEIKDIENLMNAKENGYLRSISILTQRQLLEIFFNDIKDIYYRDQSFQVFIKGIKKEFFDNIFLKDIKKRYTSFSTINKALTFPEFRNYIWKYFDIPESVELPTLPSSLLYGEFSESLHNKIFRKLVISDLSSADYKDFMVVLANRYKKSVLEFNEAMSQLDEEIV